MPTPPWPVVPYSALQNGLHMDLRNLHLYLFVCDMANQEITIWTQVAGVNRMAHTLNVHPPILFTQWLLHKCPSLSLILFGFLILRLVFEVCWWMLGVG